MNTKFELLTSDKDVRYTSAAEILTHSDKYIEFLASGETVHIARIHLEIDSTAVEIIDEMWFIAFQLCFGHINDLIQQNPFTFHAMINGKAFSFVPNSTNTDVISPDNSSCTFPSRDLMLGLYHCGIQYLEILRLLPPQGHHHNAKLIDGVFRNAQELLKSHSII